MSIPVHTRTIGDADYIIPAHCWQAYGYYASKEGRPVFASAVRASNKYMARSAVMAHRVLSPCAVITSLEPIAVYPREEN